MFNSLKQQGVRLFIHVVNLGGEETTKQNATYIHRRVSAHVTLSGGWQKTETVVRSSAWYSTTRKAAYPGVNELKNRQVKLLVGHERRSHCHRQQLGEFVRRISTPVMEPCRVVGPVVDGLRPFIQAHAAGKGMRRAKSDSRSKACTPSPPRGVRALS